MLKSVLWQVHEKNNHSLDTIAVERVARAVETVALTTTPTKVGKPQPQPQKDLRLFEKDLRPTQPTSTPAANSVGTRKRASSKLPPSTPASGGERARPSQLSSTTTTGSAKTQPRAKSSSFARKSTAGASPH